MELFNKIYCFALNFSVALCGMIYPLAYSFVRYFIYDMGVESFYFFFPTWFVFNQLCSKMIYKKFKNLHFLIARSKVSVQLENSIGICSRNCTDNGWKFSRCKHLRTIHKYFLCHLLAFHFHRCGHNKRRECIQQHRSHTIGGKSCQVDERLLRAGANLFGCKTVSVPKNGIKNNE